MEEMPEAKNNHDFIGIDFGTTNSSVARANGDAAVQLVSFQFRGAETSASRSVLYLEQFKSPSGIKRAHSFTGPTAIHRYLEADEKGRLIQSLKSHLASRSLTGTEIFGRRYRVKDLISRMLKDLRLSAEEQFGRPIRYATVGRPVRFVGSDSPEDDDFAVGR